MTEAPAVAEASRSRTVVDPSPNQTTGGRISHGPFDCTARDVNRAAYLPDWSQFVTKQDLTDLRADMERRLNTQTWTIVGTLIALGALLVATNLWG